MSTPFDPSYLAVPARALVDQINALDQELAALSDSEASTKKTVVEQIASQDSSGLGDKVVANLGNYDVAQALAMWLSVDNAVERAFGKQFKSIIDAQVAKAKAERPAVKVDENAVQEKRAARKAVYEQIDAIRNFAKSMEVMDHPDLKALNLESFSGLRGAIGGTPTGKRLAQNLVFSLDGQELPASQNNPSATAKRVGMKLADFKAQLLAEAKVPEDKAGDLNAYPAQFSFDVPNPKGGLYVVKVTKAEVADEDVEEGDEVETSE